MGHAGAIISGGSGTAEDKIKASSKAGIPVAQSPTELPELLKIAMNGGIGSRTSRQKSK